jgi:hypothetical protein
VHYSAFRLSAETVSMSLTGSRFSSDSAPRPFHHGDSKTRWNNLLGGLAVRVTAGPWVPPRSDQEGHAKRHETPSRDGAHEMVNQW